ncbi:tRNA (N6-isopentenyl adenosine(37)-C2)-methylthiotransferase MiaB [Ignavibacteria bacterium]|jgi:tRNA-2-methylthio-N6-dimethylallyladenosine synthase|nr:tRNA (N6-isopentenyl adenosine(37)-C2)-methylthiotransferase MiaB [Bacteroidota bacterium]MCZ2133792.1 tRNA (N6-isopentenyl adenosine(37)-C2)-methylthiotransferase MiaB [Bacteroidota bacterium]
MLTFNLPVLDIAAISAQNAHAENEPTPTEVKKFTALRKLYVETYGCQMNLNDSEIVMGLMRRNGYETTAKPDDADIILLNTCAVRDNAERKIHERLNHLKYYKKRNRDLVIGILGCMAERLRGDLLDKELVDMVIGPDEYRSVPDIVKRASEGEKGIAVRLSRVETYDDILPLRAEGISAWVSIMRGCDKFCSFCVVPFTRGRERSRKLQSVVDEILHLRDNGFREVTLLGQNVNSYRDEQSGSDFSDLLVACARSAPDMRLRYSTSHPYDMSDKLIETMTAYDNICKYVHLPAQSGSNRILQLMNRNYTAEHYIERVNAIKKAIPECALSTDIIVGFPTETEDDHRLTLNLMREVRYDGAYMFNYSPRENTKSWKMGDDVSQETKSRRLSEIIEMQNAASLEKNLAEIGKILEVLVEGASKRNAAEWQGRSDSNKVVIFAHNENSGYIVGDYIKVRINRATSGTLFGDTVK